MGKQINYNLSFNGNGFLDSRQGPYRLEDLKNWDFNNNPIPLGFEVCLITGDWYILNTKYNEITGFFKLRKSDSEGVKVSGDVAYVGNTIDHVILGDGVNP